MRPCLIPICILLLASMPPAAFAVSVSVPIDFPTIQDAVDSSAPGDTVWVEPGTYGGPGFVDIDFFGKELSVIGRMGPESTIISQEEGPVFFLRSGEGPGTLIRGFTMSDMTCEFFDFGPIPPSGIRTNAGTAVTIEDCIFRDHSCLPVQGANVVIRNCQFIDGLDGAVRVEGSSTVENCRFENNVFTNSGNATAISTHGDVEIRDCSFVGGGSSGVPVIYSSWGTQTLTDLEFRGCAGAGLINIENGTATLDRIAVWDCSAFGGIVHSRSSDVELNESTLAGSFSLFGSLLATDSGLITVDRSIVAFTEYGPAAHTESGGSITLSCADLYGNEGGDWTGPIAGQEAERNNLSIDPEFCDLANGDIGLAPTSPCAEENYPVCEGIGAFPITCGVASVGDDPWADSGLDVVVAPNPVGDQTRIEIRQAKGVTGDLRIELIDASGRLRRRWAVHAINGAAVVQWNGRDATGGPLPSGVYFLRVHMGPSRGFTRLLVLG